MYIKHDTTSIVTFLLQQYHTSPRGWCKTVRSDPYLVSWLKTKFPFLTSLKEQLYWLDNGLTNYPLCKTCGNKVTDFGGRNKGYFQHCSPTCAQLDKEVQEKHQTTCLEHYGVPNAAMCQEVQKRMKDTCLERYGSENVFSSEEIKRKIEQTNLDKYGVKNPQQNADIRNKSKQTVKERYGVNCGFLVNPPKNVSKGEREVQQLVRDVYSDSLNNDRKVIKPLELDIYIPSLRVGIEYDGDYWHSLDYMKQRDVIKEQLCLSKNITLIRVKESDWKNNKQQCLEELFVMLNNIREKINYGN